MPTLTAISTFVTSAGVAPIRRSARAIDGPRAATRPGGAAPAARVVGAARDRPGPPIMQSVQIGRPHSEHERPVGRSGWR